MQGFDSSEINLQNYVSIISIKKGSFFAVLIILWALLEKEYTIWNISSNITLFLKTHLPTRMGFPVIKKILSDPMIDG